ncbi:uncharacterized protein F5147DRAFT_772685 [Suillus discolor]|uniref:Uncharacterized protein n=1 Tax=Suillus discolor TaxID=1912936 RepID=A0A9P7F8F7_9AGAM|nr:uncharacterized protein F5147DRAFT_772685 [Suillus discolor]KAG2109834.1 hypothetical protein F5147DRAFT_772685 [Suillus discolor]
MFAPTCQTIETEPVPALVQSQSRRKPIRIALGLRLVLFQGVRLSGTSPMMRILIPSQLTHPNFYSLTTDDPADGTDSDGSSATHREDSPGAVNSDIDTVTNNGHKTALPSNGECGPAVTNEREKTSVPSDGECGGPAVTNEREKTAVPSDGEHSGAAAMNNQANPAAPSSNECDGDAAVNEREKNAFLSDGECDNAITTNEREKHPVASMALRPHRSSGHKSYFPSYERGSTESSGSDSDWAETEEQRKKAECSAYPMEPPRLSAEDKQKGKAVEDGHVNDSEGSDEEGRPKDEAEATHKAGRLSKEAISVVHDFRKRVEVEATEIGKWFGKHQQVILMEAGLARKATRKELIWNQHQAWFKTVLHPSKAASLQAWKAKQAEHYHAHSYKDPKNAALWKQIREHFDHAVATPNDLSSRESCSLMMAVCEMFAKSALYWHRTHGIHVTGIVIYPGDEESGRQASGFFAGSDIVKALIDAQKVDAKHMIDEITTVLKYKDLEAAQAEGKNISFFLLPVQLPNGSLLRNGKSDRDRNRMVAPVIISEAFADAGQALKTSNSRWMTMLDVLYSSRLCIHDWPTGVPPPGPDFNLKSLSASQLCTLVGPYLRKHLGAMYEAELGRDEDDDDSDAEKAKMSKRKGKSKKSNENRRTKGAFVEEPDVVLCIKEWSPLQIQDLTLYLGEVYSIPLVINTDGVILRRLQDSEKFIKDIPPHVTHKQLVTTIREEHPNSDASAEHSNPEAPCPNLQVSRSRASTAPHSKSGAPHPHHEAPRPHHGALHPDSVALRSNQGAMRSNSGALRSKQGALRSNQPVSRHTDYDDISDYNDLPPSSPYEPATPKGSNAAPAIYDLPIQQSKYTRIRQDIHCSKSDTQKPFTSQDRTSMDQRSIGHHRELYVRAPSMTHLGPIPNTACLPSRSAAVPYANRSPPCQYGRRLPAEDEYEFEYN